MDIGDYTINKKIRINGKEIALVDCSVYDFYYNLSSWIEAGARKNMHYEKKFDYMGYEVPWAHFCIDPVAGNKYVITDCEFVRDFPEEGLSDDEMCILYKCLEKEVIKIIEEKYKEKEKIKKAMDEFLCYPFDEDALK